jgi:hypothetical protein
MASRWQESKKKKKKGRKEEVKIKDCDKVET